MSSLKERGLVREPLNFAELARSSVAFMREKLERGEPVNPTKAEITSVVDGWWFNSLLPKDDYWLPTQLTVKLFERGLLPVELERFARDQSIIWKMHLAEQDPVEIYSSREEPQEPQTLVA